MIREEMKMQLQDKDYQLNKLLVKQREVSFEKLAWRLLLPVIVQLVSRGRKLV